MRSIRVLLVEDHRLVREGTKLLLEHAPDIRVVGEAGDGDGGLRLFAHLAADAAVDVVVTNIDLPGLDGLELTRQVKALAPWVRVVLLTMHDEEHYLRGMVDVEADGYVLKQSTAQDLCRAVRAAMRGEPALSPAVAGLLMRALRGAADRGPRLNQLSAREREVLRLLAEGLTSKEIAGHLGLTTKTVENHRANLLDKLEVANTAAAIGLAHRRGLLGTAGQAGAGP